VQVGASDEAMRLAVEKGAVKGGSHTQTHKKR
jgi:hypothetical protein